MSLALETKLDVNLRVGDLEKSCRWYETVFSTQPIYRGVDRSVDGVATELACFRLGGVKIWLYPETGAERLNSQQRQTVGLAFMTWQPLAELRAQLCQHQVAFEDSEIPGFPMDEYGVRIGKDAEFLYIMDPDGYKLEFCRVFPQS